MLLSAPPQTLRERLASRSGNEYGKSPQQLAAVLRYVETVEPLLRRRADLEIVTTMKVECVAELILEHLVGLCPQAAGSSPCQVPGATNRHRMKTMQCKDLGGTCDEQVSAESWEQIVQVMTKHVMQNHPDVAKNMEQMHNEDPQRWSREMKPKWDAAPES